ncbi:MAG: DUF484 family protein [Proteobacteria bacterium]|nr:DUF484 family protein [Pseudomonadota bacterium]
MSQKATRSGTAEPVDPSAKQVAAYLRAHPDFLLRHPNLFAIMEAPVRDFPDADPDGGDVVDLQHAMVGRLRTELVRNAKQHSDLIDAGRSNQRSQARIHATVLRLLSARSLDHLLELMTTDLVGLLDIDAVALCLETGTVAPATSHGIRILPSGTIDKVLASDRAVTLRDNIQGDRRIFGEAAGLVRSDALLRLVVREGGPAALLALGSRDVRRFHPGQGSELLAFLAHVMEHSICTWLDLPR